MFFLTRAGRNAILSNGVLKIEFANLRLGTGRYISQDNDARTVLQTPIITSSLTTKSAQNGRMQLAANIQTSTATAIYEAGLFDKNGVLIAISSSNTQPLLTTTPNINQVITITVTI